MLGRPELRPPVITVGSLEHLTNMAITAFKVLQTGNVGFGGGTGRAAIVDRPAVTRSTQAESVTH